MVRGRMKYVPRPVFEELNNIKLELGINRDAEAFEKMVKYSRVARELDRGFFGTSERIKPKRVK